MTFTKTPAYPMEGCDCRWKPIETLDDDSEMVIMTDGKNRWFSSTALSRAANALFQASSAA